MTMSAFPFQPRASQPPRQISEGVLALRALLEREGWANQSPPVRLENEVGGWETVAPLWMIYLQVGRDPEAFLRRLEYWPTVEPNQFDRFSLRASVKTFFFRVMMLEMVRLCALLPKWFVTEYPQVSCGRLNTLLFLRDLWRFEFFPTETEGEAVSHEQLVVDASFLLLGLHLLERARGAGYLPEDLQVRLERAIRDTYRRQLKLSKVVLAHGQDRAQVVWAQLGVWVEQTQTYFLTRSRDQSREGTVSAEWYARVAEISGRIIIALAKERSQSLQAHDV